VYSRCLINLLKHLFKLEARLPIVRGNLKIVAVTHATRVYDLGTVNPEGIADLIRDMKYIYPPTPNVSHAFPSTG
jgi:hypothetical protein